jgi:hypothetical protein
VLDATDPLVDFSVRNNNTEALALSEQDLLYLKVFQARLAEELIGIDLVVVRKKE